jgi:ketosteroid isomerase-like protein
VLRTDAADVLDRLHRAQNTFYAGGSPAPLEALLSPDVRWSVPGDNALAGTYAGREAVLGYMHARRRLAGCTFRLVRRDVLVGRGSLVVAVTDGVLVRDGGVLRWSTVGVYQLSNGLVSHCWLLPLDPVQFDSVWQ